MPPMSFRPLALLALLALSGCEPDQDADGFVAAVDCDDDDASVHPGAIEVCNGIDDNCDGLDEYGAIDAVAFFADADTDGYGSGLSPIHACEAPPGYVAEATDCDDANDSIHPGADEVCNGVDDDCNGVIDDDAIDATTWHVDSDGDGYGDPLQTVVACEQPLGAVSDATDCDDHEDSTHPGADEWCDGVDNDCDTVPDGPNALDPLTWYEDLDGDTWGNESVVALACEAPPGFVDRAGDCADGSADISPDATEDCGDGIDNNCSGDDDHCGDRTIEGVISAGDTSAYWSGTPDSRAGKDLAIVGDLDADGYDDLVVGAEEADIVDGPDDGVAWVIYGGPSLPGTWALADQPGFVGAVTEDQLGDRVSAAGDVDGDGFDDLLLGAKTEDSLEYNGGAAYLLHGGAPRWTDQASITSADASFVGDGYYHYLGSALAGVGDVDGDGNDDYLIGEDGHGYPNGYGAAYLVYGDVARRSGTQDLDSLPRFVGQWADKVGGERSLGGGDFDGDGLADMLIGTSNYEEGHVYVVHGDPVRFSIGSNDLVTAPTLAGAFSPGEEVEFGATVTNAGDLNDDGYPDAAVGAPLWSATSDDAGAVWVFPGGPTPWVGQTLLDETLLYVVGESSDLYVGEAITSVELDSDGIDDLVVGCYSWNQPFDDAGTAVVVFGDAAVGGTVLLSNAELRVEGQFGGDRLGDAVAAGDMDGDGLADLALGASGRSTLNGGVHLLLGTVWETL